MTRDEAIEMLKALNMMLRSPDGKPISDACDALDMAIEALSDGAVQGWIPCSERLPKTGDSVLVTYSDGEVDIIWSARPKAWVTYSERNNLIYPIAWMLLPKPYKGAVK